AAWYLAVNWSRIDAAREQVLDDFRAAEDERHDEDALRLALLGGLVQLGWDKALHASGHPDPAIRAREAGDLAWCTERAREALGVWSPSCPPTPAERGGCSPRPTTPPRPA